MYVSMYVCMYVCMYVYIYLYIRSNKFNKFLVKHFVIKTSDKKYEQRFDHSTVIFKFKYMDKNNSAYIQFLKQCNRK